MPFIYLIVYVFWNVLVLVNIGHINNLFIRINGKCDQKFVAENIAKKFIQAFNLSKLT